MISSRTIRSAHRAGLTLVEILVVVTILVIVSAILVPQLRIVNKDRNIREAARVVASTFSKASQNAANDGVAGVLLVRNPNINDSVNVPAGREVPFAVTTLYLLRKVPVYAGDDDGSVATRLGDLLIQIDKPLEQDDLNIIQVFDSLSLNFANSRYLITNVVTDPMDATRLNITLSNSGNLLPVVPGNDGDTFPFVVHRRPRKLDTSRVDLPDGYVVDMRYSGPVFNVPSPPRPGTDPLPLNRSVFHEVISPALNDLTTPTRDQALETRIVFDQTGGIDRMYYYDIDADLGNFPDGAINTLIPADSLYLFIAEYESDPPANYGEIAQPGNLWVAVNHTTGAATVQYNTPSVGADLGIRIVNSQAIAETGQSALQ